MTPDQATEAGVVLAQAIMRLLVAEGHTNQRLLAVAIGTVAGGLAAGSPDPVEFLRTVGKTATVASIQAERLIREMGP